MRRTPLTTTPRRHADSNLLIKLREGYEPMTHQTFGKLAVLLIIACSARNMLYFFVLQNPVCWGSSHCRREELHLWIPLRTRMYLRRPNLSFLCVKFWIHHSPRAA